MMAFKAFVNSVFNLKTRKVNLYFNFLRYKSEGIKVVLINSFSALGRSTAYLLKKSDSFSEICLQDTRNIPIYRGVAADLNNINSHPTVTYSMGLNSLANALQGARIVVVLEKEIKKKKNKQKNHCEKKGENKKYNDENDCAHNKTTIALNNLFSMNAEVCARAAALYAKICPEAFLAVTAQPINSILPLVCSVANAINHNVDTRKILGFMSLDVIKANLIWAKKMKINNECASIPVIGGTTANTLIPLFSQSRQPKQIKKSQVEYEKITEEVRNTSIEVAPLAKAASISKFIITLGHLINGNETKETLFVASDIHPEIKYIAGTAQLGPAGVQYMLPFPKLSEHEKLLLDSLAFYLKSDIKIGENYAEKYLKKEKHKL